MSIELKIIFAIVCFACAIGMLFFGLGTANEFIYKAEKMEKWAKEELDHGERGEQP